MKCFAFGVGYISDMDDCRKCKKSAPKRHSKCKKLTNELIEEVCSSDEEIEKWIKERKK